MRFLFIPLLAALFLTSARADDRYFVPATIDGKDVMLAFDSGSTVTWLFRPAAERLGLKINPLKNGPLTGQTDPVNLKFLSIDVKAPLAIVDAPPGPFTGIDGVIGWRPLRNNVFVFNPEKRNIDIGKVVPEEAKTWTKYDVDGESVLQLLVPTRDGKKGIVMIDTGSTVAVTVTEAHWKEWSEARANQVGSMVAYSSPKYGLTVAKELWADQFSLGDLTLKGVGVSKENGVGKEVPNFIGVIGEYGLRRMHLVIDGPNKVAYVKPVEGKAPPYNHNRLGAVFVPDPQMKTDALLARVAKGTPADLAGIRDGDRLLKIDDLDVTPWRTKPGILPLARFFQKEAGTKLKLSIEREGKTMVVEAELKDLLGAK